MTSLPIQDYVDLFNQCYPQFAMMKETFAKLILRENAKVLEERDPTDKLQGFAVVEEFALRLLCVAPAMQNKGVGTKLLLQTENHVRACGYNKIITGGVSSGFLIGADERAWPFFEKNGYQRVGACDEMLLQLTSYQLNRSQFHGHEEAVFDWYQGDIKSLQDAVRTVDEEWIQYFTNPERAYVGMVGDEIASFCLVDTGWQNYLTDAYGKVGAPGCVGTVPKYRNRGIALEMVAEATQYLKEQGMDISFIFFTGVADWYRKIGYQTFVTEIFGEKPL